MIVTLTSLPTPESCHRDPFPPASEQRERILRLERMVAGGYPIGEGLSDGGIGCPVKAKEDGEVVDAVEETPSVR